METAIMQERVIITGAGIAGMTTALALAAHNIPSDIYEKSAMLEEVGAGIQLAANACRLLYRLGLEKALEPYVSEPEFINLKHADSNRTLLSLPIKAISEQRWQAPYLTIHRADLQTVLKEQIDANPLISYHGSSSVQTVRGSAATEFTAEISTKSIYSANAASDTEAAADSAAQAQSVKTHHLVCCDGVWSRSRAAEGDKARFSSYIAWRATLKREDLPAQAAASGILDSVSAYMSKDSHFIIYPLRKGALYNFVVITKGEDVGHTWSHIGDKEKLLRLFSGQSPLLREIIAAVPSWTYWPLFQMPFSRFLGIRGAVFLGDAAHAIIPFAAQGAAMAIEDACALAETIALNYSADTSAGSMENIARFNAVRQERIKAVAKRSIFNGIIYHLSGIAAIARNCVMRLRPQTHFITDLDWLYSYDATAPFIKRSANKGF